MIFERLLKRYPDLLAFWHVYAGFKLVQKSSSSDNNNNNNINTMSSEEQVSHALDILSKCVMQFEPHTGPSSSLSSSSSSRGLGDDAMDEGVTSTNGNEVLMDVGGNNNNNNNSSSSKLSSNSSSVRQLRSIYRVLLMLDTYSGIRFKKKQGTCVVRNDVM